MFRFFLLALVGLVAASDPSLNIGFGTAPLQKIIDSLVPPVIQGLNGMTLAPISGSSHVGGLVGDVDYTITGIVFESVSASNPALSTAAGLGVALDDLKLTVKANFEVKETDWPHVSTHGTVTAEVGSSDVDLVFNIDPAASTGAPTFVVESSSVTIGDIKLHFSDNFFSWLENLLSGLFTGTIKDKVRDAIQKELSVTLATTVNTDLAKLPMSTSLGDFGTLQWSVAQDSIASPSGYVVSLAADVTTQSNPVAPPLAHHTLPTSGSEMADLWLDSYIVDSLFWTLEQDGQLSKTYTNGDIFPPSSAIGKLINETWTSLCDKNPILKNLLPLESSILTFQFDTITQPELHFEDATDIHIDIPFEIDILAVDSAIKAISIEAPTKASLALTLELGESGYALVPALETFTFSIANITSVVGPIKAPEEFNKIVNVVLNEVALPYINQLLAKGIALPTLPLGLKLQNPELGFGAGYIHIGSDLSFPSGADVAQEMTGGAETDDHLLKLSMGWEHEVTADNVAAVLKTMQ